MDSNTHRALTFASLRRTGSNVLVADPEGETLWILQGLQSALLRRPLLGGALELLLLDVEVSLNELSGQVRGVRVEAVDDQVVLE